MTCTCQPVGEREIAPLLGVQPNTVHQWRKRGLLPEPRWTVSGMPAWDQAEIEAWARATGRLPKRAVRYSP